MNNSTIFVFLFARIFAIMRVAPLLSSQTVPSLARVALALFTSILLMPLVVGRFEEPTTVMAFIGILIGEIMLGLLQGFFLVVIYSSFQVAGQFFSLQMGFGASQVFDPLAQIEIPILGQVLNLVAMFVLIGVSGFQKIFLVHIYRGIDALNAWEVLGKQAYFQEELIFSLGNLFVQSFVMSLPILGTLMLVSVTMGLMAKAAPQMNLLMIGFPISISVGFLVMFMALPFLAEGFGRVIQSSFDSMSRMIQDLTPLGGTP